MNGALSRGPISTVGKAISSTNAIRSGLEARCVLLPGEDLEDRVAIYQAMTQTFGGRTPAEAMVIARAPTVSSGVTDWSNSKRLPVKTV
jgi:hypothetical protein